MLFHAPLFCQITAGIAELKPLIILLLAIAFILMAIIKFRVHAFLALVGASLFVAVISAGSIPGMVENIKLVSMKFGQTAGGIGLVIALAAIIGMGLMDSGGADSIVRRFIRIFGETRAAWALLISGFILSIPVFFDTVFFLLIPIARMLGIRTGKNYMLYVLAIGGGGIISHSLVPPTPGPLIMADVLGLDLGMVILVGCLASIIPLVSVVYIAKRMDKANPMEVREISDSKTGHSEVKAIQVLPPFWFSVLPVLLPIVLITAFSFNDMMEKERIKKEVLANTAGVNQSGNAGEVTFENMVREAQANPDNYSALHGVLSIFGEKVIALGIGSIFAIWLLFYTEKLTWKAFGEKCAPPLEMAGIIILITSAGGSFGAMITNTGIGDFITSVAENFDVSYILLAWVITAVIKIAQGSGTVSMITGIGLMSAVLLSLQAAGKSLPYSPFYIYMAVGFGSIICSWMNDSAFWIVGKLSGFSEGETLRTWTILLTLISIIGLLQTIIFSLVMPLQ
ncbi:MAG: GntP family permease [Cyclobacteriaceae bacterium]|nr:GntP family permease [Cyclobacteriaceae bacterium]